MRALVILVLSIVSVSAQTPFALDNATSNLQTGHFTVESLAITNMDANPVRVRILDAPGTNLVFFRTNVTVASQAPVGQAIETNIVVQPVNYPVVFTIRLNTNCYSPVVDLSGKRIQHGLLIQASGAVTGSLQTE